MRNLILTLIIWTICFTAIVVGSSLTYKWYRQLGKDINIHFTDAAGLVPHQSKIVYLGVEIGSVTKITLDANTKQPIVTVRVSKEYINMLGPKSKFWIIRPEFSLGGISNLSAISTGDYITVYPVPGEYTPEFTGEKDTPVDYEFDAGLKLVLRGLSASGIDIGSGVLYHDLPIGEVGEMDLDKDGRHVLITVYINRKYARVIRKSSYFGNISGFHADIHIFGGSQISLNSIRTLVRGGIKIETPTFNSPMVKDGAVFKLLSHEELEEFEEKMEREKACR